MDHQIAIDDLGLLRCLVGNRETGAILVDFQNLGPGPQIDPQLPGRFAENVGEIRIEIAERLLHHFQNGHLARASTLGDVREFHRNESTRSEEHTSELQSLMRISYAVFCLKKKTHNTNHYHSTNHTHITNTSVKY